MSADRPGSSEGISLAERVASRLTAVRAAPAPNLSRESPQPAVPRAIPAAPIGAAPLPQAVSAAPPPSAETAGSSQAVLQINFQKLQSAGFMTPSSPRTANTEAIRGIKRQLLKHAFPQEPHAGKEGGSDNVIMITSSMPGEGKTFISLNLAMSISAERDLFVLLIDADCHLRSMGELLGAKADVGLVDILVDRSLNLGELIQRTNIPNLSFLPGGRPHANSAELLSSKQFGLLMQDIAARYPDRMIIIDTPPVLASTEAVVLSGYVGQTIIVVEKDRTTKRQLHRTLQMLDAARNLGCVLNMVPSEETFTEYGY